MAIERDSQANPGIDTFLGWVGDSYEAFADNRAEQWRDFEMYDGIQWTPDQVQQLKDVLGMHALTINRTFPTVNMLLGLQISSQTDISAKGRTVADTDVTSIASGSLKFVMDQNDGLSKIHQAFRGQIIPGFGAIEVLKNPDPRKEVVKLALRSWQYMWWDAHGDPWFDVDTTRYVFLQKWVDLHDLIGMLPKQKEVIQSYFSSAPSRLNGVYPFAPTGSIWEPFSDGGDWRTASIWVDRARKRVMPIEMWYTVRKRLLFATFADGRAYDFEGKTDSEIGQLVQQCQEIVEGYVPKMRVALLLGDNILFDQPTPHGHDDFPFACFVGYTDRFNKPYGVPRQIRDMDIETNKRRTTALAKLNAKRVIVEDGAVDDMGALRQEAMRPDGVIILRKGKRIGEHIIIEDQNSEMRGQIQLLQESEREIGEITGAVGEQMGYETNAVSSVAMQQRSQKGGTITAPLFGNLKKGKTKLGYLAVAGIQSLWKQEKVIRVTDSFRGSDKLIVVNQRTMGAGGVVIKNRLEDIKFDIVVTDEIFSDVVREKFAQILIESTKRADPSAVPLIMDVAFEMLDLPKKEFILTRLRQAFNLEIPPEGEDFDKEEAAKQIQAQRQRQSEIQDKVTALDLEERALKNEKTIAQIKKLISQAAHTEKQSTRADIDAELALTSADREEERLRLETGKTQHDMGMKEVEVIQKEKDRVEQNKAKKKGGVIGIAKKRVANS
ncbi:MAG: hypothetical protein PHC68_00335 [Syntrophorhabdaceae bacterium]|nr:hypothetical protein [Syntrophorhabdaceae bacterium]